MNGKLLILLVAGMLMGNAAVFAQKKSKDPFAKEIAAEQKRLESEGWKVWNSTEVLHQLLRQKYVMQNELMVTADGEKKNDRTGTSISKHSNVRMNKVERVLTLYRETAQGQYCVEVCMALDLKN